MSSFPEISDHCMTSFVCNLHQILFNYSPSGPLARRKAEKTNGKIQQINEEHKDDINSANLPQENLHQV